MRASENYRPPSAGECPTCLQLEKNSKKEQKENKHPVNKKKLEYWPVCVSVCFVLLSLCVSVVFLCVLVFLCLCVSLCLLFSVFVFALCLPVLPFSVFSLCSVVFVAL